MQLYDFIGKTFNLLVDQDHQLLTDLFIASRPSYNKSILIKYSYYTGETFCFPFNRKNRREFLHDLSINNNFSSPPIVSVEILQFIKLRTTH